LDRQPDKQGLYDPRYEHDACGVGFVAHIKGHKSHDLIRQGLQILLNLDHRGAVGADPLAGDGAGILIQIPDEFFRAVCTPLGIVLPSPGRYGVGMAFLPKRQAARDACETMIERIIESEGQRVLGWRDVPVDHAGLGATVLATEPFVRQVFIGRGTRTRDQDAFERKLFVIRKQIQNQ
jgi:glutamate synthase (NADPH/NADH) large chain